MDFNVTNENEKEAEILEPGARVPAIPKGALVLPSMAELRKGIEGFEKQIEVVKTRLATFEIKSDDDLAAAIDTRQQAKDIFSSIEGAIEPKVSGAKKLVSDANAIVRHFREMLIGDQKKRIPGVVGSLNEQILLYQMAKQIEEQKAQKKREEDLRKAEANLQKKAKEEGVEAPPPLPVTPKPVAPQKTHSTASGAKATIVERWTFDPDFVDFETFFVETLRSMGYTVERKDPKFEPTDADRVNFKYVMLDSKEVNAAIGAGVRHIPGVNIFKKEYVR